MQTVTDTYNSYCDAQFMLMYGSISTQGQRVWRELIADQETSGGV